MLWSVTTRMYLDVMILHYLSGLFLFFSKEKADHTTTLSISQPRVVLSPTLSHNMNN